MNFGPDDMGLLDYKTEEETKEYLEELGMKFKYGCKKEKNAIQCHSLGSWFQSFKHDYKAAESVFRENCFSKKFPESCIKYSFLKLLGADNIRREKGQSLDSLRFGCRVTNDARCCQAAGELLLEEAGTDNAKLDSAAEFFTLGSQNNLAMSKYYLGGLFHTKACLQRQEDVRQSGNSEQPRSKMELDYRKSAIDYWISACDQGHGLSCRNAARAFRLGDGVDKDSTISDKYSKMAQLSD